MITRLAESRSADEGITLIELLIYILLAAIVGTIVAGILINSLRVQVQIQDASAAAQGTYLVADALGSAVRNSTGMALMTLPGGSVTLLTRSLDPSAETEATIGPGDYVCYAFAFVGSELRFATEASAITVSVSEDTDDWTVIADGLDDDRLELALNDDGTTVTVSVINEIGDGGPQQLTTTIRSLQGDDPVNGERVSEPCF